MTLIDRKIVRETALRLVDEKYAIENNDLSASLGVSLISAANLLSRNHREWGLNKVGVGVSPYDSKAAYCKLNGDEAYKAKSKAAIEEIRQRAKDRYEEKIRANAQKRMEEALSRRKKDAVVKKFIPYEQEKAMLETDVREWLRKIHEEEKKPMSTCRIKELYCGIFGKRKKSSDKWFEIMEERKKAIDKGEYEYKSGCSSLKTI